MTADEHKSTVCLTVDFDAVALWMSWGARGARALSRGDYDALHGAPRLLDVFEKYDVQATWFVPGHTAETYPDITASIAAKGHEIANHGYHHEDFGLLQEDDVRNVIKRSNEALERVTGMQPTGIRVPAGDFEEALLQLFLEEGFYYDSSLMGEFELRWCREPRSLTSDGPNAFGSEIDLVEVPYSLVMSSFTYLEFNITDPVLWGLCEPQKVLEIWNGQFDYMHENVPNGTMTLGLHSQTVGWGHRSTIVEAFIERCLGHENVEFLTCDGAARRFREQQPRTKSSAVTLAGERAK